MVFDKVKQYIEKNNLTVAAFEKLCSIGNGTISGWKEGNPSMKTLKKMETATGIPVSDWLKN